VPRFGTLNKPLMHHSDIPLVSLESYSIASKQHRSPETMPTFRLAWLGSCIPLWVHTHLLGIAVNRMVKNRLFNTEAAKCLTPYSASTKTHRTAMYDCAACKTLHLRCIHAVSSRVRSSTGRRSVLQPTAHFLNRHLRMCTSRVESMRSWLS
jgi:hypothetical protein